MIETLHTTTEHPFLTTDRGFVDVILLMPGEQVRQLSGSVGIVVSVTIVPGTAVRYNLTVQDKHTYAVGDDQWIVHNCNIDPTDPLINFNPASTDDTSGKEIEPSVPGDLILLIQGQPNLYYGQRYDTSGLNAKGWIKHVKHPFVNSSDFIRFAHSIGTDILDWEYTIEEWTGPNGEYFENYFWFHPVFQDIH